MRIVDLLVISFCVRQLADLKRAAPPPTNRPRIVNMGRGRFDEDLADAYASNAWAMSATTAERLSGRGRGRPLRQAPNASTLPGSPLMDPGRTW